MKNRLRGSAWALRPMSTKRSPPRAALSRRFSHTSKEERLALLQKIVDIYQKHYGEMVETISREMGAPLGLSKAAQAAPASRIFGAIGC